jgi:hypothetical protein
VLNVESSMNGKTRCVRAVLCIGKGGVGKTTVATALAEWLLMKRLQLKMFDCTDSRGPGSLTHFFGPSVSRVDIHTPPGLDAVIDHPEERTRVILADMSAESAQITHDWFDKMRARVAPRIAFTAIGVVTGDPASVGTILGWVHRLQNRVEYLIVENAIISDVDFSYWRNSRQACEFRKAFRPRVIYIDHRVPEFENDLRNYGATLSDVVARTTKTPQLHRAAIVRARTYRQQVFAQFDAVKRVLTPVGPRRPESQIKKPV